MRLLNNRLYAKDYLVAAPAQLLGFDRYEDHDMISAVHHRAYPISPDEPTPATIELTRSEVDYLLSTARTWAHFATHPASDKSICAQLVEVRKECRQRISRVCARVTNEKLMAENKPDTAETGGEVIDCGYCATVGLPMTLVQARNALRSLGWRQESGWQSRWRRGPGERICCCPWGWLLEDRIHGGAIFRRFVDLVQFLREMTGRLRARLAATAENKPVGAGSKK